MYAGSFCMPLSADSIGESDRVAYDTGCVKDIPLAVTVEIGVILRRIFPSDPRLDLIIIGIRLDTDITALDDRRVDNGYLTVSVDISEHYCSKLSPAYKRSMFIPLHYINASDRLFVANRVNIIRNTKKPPDLSSGFA